MHGVEADPLGLLPLPATPDHTVFRGGTAHAASVRAWYINPDLCE